jgi:hypothetical protein
MPKISTIDEINLSLRPLKPTVPSIELCLHVFQYIF